MAKVTTVKKKPVAVKKPSVTVIGFSEEATELIKTLIIAIASKPAPVISVTGAKKEVTEDHKEDPKEETTITVSLSSIAELIQLKASEGKTKQIVALLSKHGAKNASSLEKAEYEPFFNSLKNL